MRRPAALLGRAIPQRRAARSQNAAAPAGQPCHTSAPKLLNISLGTAADIGRSPAAERVRQADVSAGQGRYVPSCVPAFGADSRAFRHFGRGARMDMMRIAQVAPLAEAVPP